MYDVKWFIRLNVCINNKLLSFLPDEQLKKKVFSNFNNRLSRDRVYFTFDLRPFNLQRILFRLIQI